MPLSSEIVLEAARNLNRTSAEISAQSIPLLNSWQRDWNTQWPYADYLETSAASAMTDSTQTYTLATDMDKLLSVWVPALGKLTILSDEQLRALGSSAVYGNPIAYSVFGESQVNFFPIPTSAYGFSYAYYKTINEITTASALSAQTPAIGSKYHDSGIWYLTWKLAVRMGDVDMVAMAKAEYDRIFANASADMINRVAGTKRIRFANEQYENMRIIKDKADEMFLDS